MSNSIVITEKIDIYSMNSIGINKKLAKRFNAILNFINKNTVLECGCLNGGIKEVRYTREGIARRLFETNDTIEVVTEHYGTFSTSKLEEIKIDRKYNAIEFGNYFNVLNI